MEIGQEVAYTYKDKTYMGTVVEVNEKRAIVNVTSCDKPKGFKPGKFSVMLDYLQTIETQVQLTALAQMWGKYLEIDWYNAMADVEEMNRKMGIQNTAEFISRRMNGEKLSFLEFSKSKGF